MIEFSVRGGLVANNCAANEVCVTIRELPVTLPGEQLVSCGFKAKDEYMNEVRIQSKLVVLGPTATTTAAPFVPPAEEEEGLDLELLSLLSAATGIGVACVGCCVNRLRTPREQVVSLKRESPRRSRATTR